MAPCKLCMISHDHVSAFSLIRVSQLFSWCICAALTGNGSVLHILNVFLRSLWQSNLTFNQCKNSNNLNEFNVLKQALRLIVIWVGDLLSILKAHFSLKSPLLQQPAAAVPWQTQEEGREAAARESKFPTSLPCRAVRAAPACCWMRSQDFQIYL